MEVLTYIVVGTLFCLTEPGAVNATQYRGPADGVEKSEIDGAQDQLMLPGTVDRRTTAVMQDEGVTALPSDGPWNALSEELPGMEKQQMFHAIGSDIRSGTQEPVGFVGHRIWSERARGGRRKPVSGSNKAFTHQYDTAGLNRNGTTPNSSGSVNAGSVQVFPSLPVPSTVDAMGNNSVRGVPYPRSARSKVLAPAQFSVDSDESSQQKGRGGIGRAEDEMLHLLVTAGLIEQLIVDEHYRSLAIRFFERRARTFSETFGHYPDDNVLARFFRSAEEGTLEEELNDIPTLKLFFYCMHLEARDMTRGYLFPPSKDVIPPNSSDFEATLELFRHAVVGGTLATLLDDEAERYVFYRFYVALAERTRTQGNREDLPDVDKYIVNLVSSNSLESELDNPEGRQEIIKMVTSAPGILNGLHLPPPRTPGPEPPPTGSVTAPPSPEGPQPEPPRPRPPPRPRGSATTPLNFSAWLTLLLTLGIAASV